MKTATHWEEIYLEKTPDTVSWYRPHLETSLELIENAAPARDASIIDVGGDESTLVDDLLARRYQNVTVLDVPQTAVEVTKKRLGSSAGSVQWLTTDITKSHLAPVPTMYGTTGPYFISVLSQISASRTFVKLWAQLSPAGMSSSALSARKVPRNAAASTYCVTTQSHCARSLVYIFGCWRV